MNIEIGSITWMDLTVPNATTVRDFYSKVVGWQSEPVSMGDYEDFSMNRPGTGETAAGICHTRGMNKDIPPQWLIYITVEDVYKSADTCRKNGGEVVMEPRKMGDYGQFCIIRDPAGAVAALFTPAESTK